MKAELFAQRFGATGAVTDLKGQTVRGGVVTATAQVAKFALQFGSTMILARLLSPTDFGLVAMVAAVTGLAALFKDMGLSAAVVQRPQITHAEVSNLFWVSAATSVSLVGIMAALAPLLAMFYGESRLTAIGLVIAGSFLPGGLVVQHQALLRRQLRFTALAAVEVVSQFIGIAAGVVAAFQGAEYWSLLIMQWAQVVAYLVGAWTVCGWWPSWPQRGVPIRSLLRFGGQLTGANLLGYLNTNVDRVLIGRWFGSDAVGVYSRAFSLLLLPLQQISGPLNTVTVPALARLVADPARFRRVLLRMLEFNLVVSSPVIAVMLATADWLVRVALGPQWDVAAQIFAVLGLLAFAQPFANAAMWVFVTQDQTRRLLRWSVGNSVLVVAGLAIGLPWGPMGVATAYAVTGFLVRIPIFLWVAGRCGPVTVRDYYQVGVPHVVTAFLVWGALRGVRFWWLTDLDAGLGLVVCGIAGVALYFVLVLLWPRGRSAVAGLREVSALLRPGSAAPHE